MHRTLARRYAAWLVVALAVGACTDSPAQAPSVDPGVKAGGKPGPVTITVADSQFAGRPSNLPLDEFERLVESASGGTLQVEILTEASADADLPHSDGPVIEKVRSGAFEMAVVPARAWSAGGVMSLRALQAPFLFTSDGHVAAALRDPAITGDLLGGFEGTGITGLTLFPESQRHLFSFGAPFLTPSDVHGKTFQAIASLETTAIFEALGGKAVYLTDADYAQRIEAGTIDGTDSGFVIAAMGMSNQATTATGNVAPYAKVISLVVNTEFWNSLGEAQRGIVTDAATATREWAIDHQQTEADAAVAFCKGGGRVVLADRLGLEAFRGAEKPVYEALEADPQTKRSLSAIAALAGRGDGQPLEACGPDAPVLEPEGGDLPDGIYRVEATAEFLKANFPDAYPGGEGVTTFTLDDGRWTFEFVNPKGELDDASHQLGTYRVDGQNVQWLWDPRWSHPNPVLDATWFVDPDGTLHFQQRSGPPDWTLALPFVRVGDLP